jgi:hypothetical protein
MVKQIHTYPIDQRPEVEVQVAGTQGSSANGSTQMVAAPATSPGVVRRPKPVPYQRAPFPLSP